jgi:hypothetical protein
MVKIRYAEMPDGIRARTDRGRHGGGGRVTITLAPGMTPPQRRAMLGRLVRNSRIPGYGPPLPGAGVALAYGQDAAREYVRDVAAAARLHPAQTLIGAGFVAGLVTCYMVFVSVSVNLGPARPPLAAQGIPPAIRVHARRVPRTRPGAAASPAPRGGVPVAAVATRRTGTTGRTSAPQPLVTRSAPMPAPSADPSPSTAAAPTPSVTPSPAQTGACLQLGPVGVCVGV